MTDVSATFEHDIGATQSVAGEVKPRKWGGDRLADCPLQVQGIPRDSPLADASTALNQSSIALHAYHTIDI